MRWKKRLITIVWAVSVIIWLSTLPLMILDTSRTSTALALVAALVMTDIAIKTTAGLLGLKFLKGLVRLGVDAPERTRVE